MLRGLRACAIDFPHCYAFELTGAPVNPSSFYLIMNNFLVIAPHVDVSVQPAHSSPYAVERYWVDPYMNRIP